MGGAWPDALTRPFTLLRRAPPELRLVYLVKALDSYGYFALSEVFTTYFSEFGVSDVAAGTYYGAWGTAITCLLYTSPSPRDATLSRMPSSA